MSVVYAQFSTWVTPTVAIARGEIWDSEDPVVQSHPDWFTADPSDFVRRSGVQVEELAPAKPEPKVEQATAAPGERRTVKRG